MHAVAFWTSKQGNGEAEYEDAFGLSATNLRVAVADGASSSFMAQDWARTLVDRFRTDPPASNEVDALEGWLASCAAGFEAIPIENTDTWYVHEATHRGAFATMLGLRISKANGTWSALAIGDTCVFHIRSGDLLTAFPLSDADSFDSTPALAASLPRNESRGAGAARSTTGSCRPGDVFLVATDAFSQWALRSAERTPGTWEVLASLSPDGFDELVDQLREHELIENDDVTLARCVISEAEGER